MFAHTLLFANLGSLNHVKVKYKVMNSSICIFISPVSTSTLFVCLFVCFVALRPKSTAMVIAGRSVHLTTLFPGQA